MADLRGTPAVWQERICLVDADGSAPLDLVGLVSATKIERRGTLHVFLSDKPRLVILEGDTGETLWWGPEYPKQAHVLCADPNWIVAHHPKSRIAISPARSPSDRRQIPITRRLARYAGGAGCMALETGTQHRQTQVVGFDNATGSSCKLEMERQYWAQRPAPHIQKRFSIPASTQAWIAVDTVRWEAIPPPGVGATRVAGGPDRLFAVVPDPKDATAPPSLEGRLESEPDWSTTLPLAAHTVTMVDAGRTLVLWGSKRSDTIQGRLVGIDPRNGAKRYEHIQHASNAGMVMARLRFNGSLVIAQVGGGVYAYEPTTGKRVWGVGSAKWKE